MDKEILQSKSKLLRHLGLNRNYLFADFDTRYTTKTIPKKNGGLRTIKPPTKKLKEVQRKILDDILSHVLQLDCVYGLSKSKGIKANAVAHLPNYNTHLVNLDVTDFFPSISYKLIRDIFISIGCSEDCANCLTKLCTYDGYLPQGAPTSPFLSALAFKKIDQKIFDYARKNGLVYTRYFDDVTLSGDGLTSRCIKKVEQIIADGGFIPNDKKREVFQKTDIKRVTGIVLYGDALDVSEEQKEKIMRSYQTFTGTSERTSANQFWGQLGFYLYINRALAEEYFERLTNIPYRNKRAVFPV